MCLWYGALTSSDLASLLALRTTEFYVFIPPLHLALLHSDAFLIGPSSPAQPP